MVKHKQGKKKALLSNVDVPVSQSNAQVVKANVEPQTLSKEIKVLSHRQTSRVPVSGQEVPSFTPAEYKYVLPELFSTLAVSSKIERVKNTQAAPITNSSQLTPDSKKKLITKITKKLNHQPDTNVYSGLAPVVVTNEQCPQAEPRAKYKVTGKNPEPVLADFLIPLEPYVAKVDVHTPVNKIGKELQDNFANIMYVMSILDGEFPSKAS